MSCYRALHILDGIVSYQPTLIKDFVQLGGESVLAGVVSVTRNQLKAADWSGDKLMAKRSLELVTKLHDAIEQRRTAERQAVVLRPIARMFVA